MIASSAAVSEQQAVQPRLDQKNFLSCRSFPWDQRERGLDRLVKPFAPEVDH